MHSLFSLQGKTALVTGANTGIGQGICAALAAAGADIAGVGRSEMGDTCALVTAAGAKFCAISADLSSLDPVERVLNEAVGAFGKIDIIVNNAGIIRRADAVEYSVSDWDDVLNINLRTLFFLCQAAGRYFIENHVHGKIINIASMLSYQGGIRVPAYTAAKHGVAGVTRALACEWAQHGVNVNAIAPGYIATNNTAALRDDPDRSASILGRIPAGRWGEPCDIGGAAVFLASRAADYVHGAIIDVDGGWQAR